MDQSQAQRGHEPIPLEVLRDRYDGLMTTPGEDPSKLQYRLWSVLDSIVEGVARRDLNESGAEHVTSELSEMVREHVLRRLQETGAAR